jgi:hypothetical protein
VTDERRPAAPERDDDALGDALGDALTREPSETDALPIVARMVVEIRSDGTRTIARGAIEDRLQNHQVGVEASADSPLELARALAKLLVSAPLSGMLRGKLPSPDPGPDRGDREVAGPETSGVRGYLGGLRETLSRRAESVVERTLARRLGPRKRDRDEDARDPEPPTRGPSPDTD